MNHDFKFIGLGLFLYFIFTILWVLKDQMSRVWKPDEKQKILLRDSRELEQIILKPISKDQMDDIIRLKKNID